MQNNTFSTLFVGQNFIKLKEVDSTNNYLKNIASKSEPLPEGTVIMADNQFAGRGQQDNVWKTESGKNISLSIYLRPSFLPLNKQFYLNMAVSLAISEAMSDFLPERTTIKWPNDIYYHDKKIGGILIENTLTGSSIKSSVIGVGLNINQENFNDELRNKAISIIQVLNHTTELQSIVNKICVYIEKFYFELKSENYQVLQKNYFNNLYKFDITSLFRDKDEVFEGKIKGVEQDGRLIVKTKNNLKIFGFKEIEFIHNT